MADHYDDQPLYDELMDFRKAMRHFRLRDYWPEISLLVIQISLIIYLFMAPLTFTPGC